MTGAAHSRCSVITCTVVSSFRRSSMIQLKVNGTSRQFDGDPDMPLLWYLRDVIDLTGTKYGCGVAQCGACTVHIDGKAMRSCQTAMKTLAGKSVVTIEGLA